MMQLIKKMSINDLIKEIEQIPGWLAPEAAYFTAKLLDYQKDIKFSGNIVEIGVYCGKYLAILYNYLSVEDEFALGIDAFIGSDNTELPKENVFKNIKNICGQNQRLDILAKNSLELTPEAMLQLVRGDKARFISIDGGHTADVVSHDLVISNAILKPGGVIAMDDIFNHSLPGVTEGLFEYMQKANGNTLAPFAHCYNKLFLTTPEYYDNYYKKSYEILESMIKFDAYKRTNARIAENKCLNFTPSLFGYEILSFL